MPALFPENEEDALEHPVCFRFCSDSELDSMLSRAVEFWAEVGLSKKVLGLKNAAEKARMELSFQWVACPGGHRYFSDVCPRRQSQTCDLG